jgi:cysteinyl-tRNA synthetase
MALKVYNSLSRKKEDFQSLEVGKVKMYCCGPTVYDFLHVGNFRGAVVYNFVRNWLEKSGYQVNFVYNFTDVDDKIINRAIKENTTAKAIAEKYIEEFKKDFSHLGLRPHNHNPRVTEHIDGIIRLIQKLIDNKKAYVVEGEVFYSIRSFPQYGKLSNRKVDDMEAGARVEIDVKKQDALDFTLWKPAKPGEQSWPSPWGEGRPGWHIECSCMIHDILGEQIDIHGGGMDLIFPHHENEIAQGEGASGKTYSRYWLHNNMFTFSGAKMSKSLGNIRTMRSFLEEYPAEIFKYLVMSVHYRSESEFSDATIAQSIAGLARIYSALKIAEEYSAEESTINFQTPALKEFAKNIADAQQKMNEAYDDDFNTSKAFADLFEVVRLFNQKVKPGVKASPDILGYSFLFRRFVLQNGQMMALFHEPAQKFLRSLDRMLIRQKNLDESLIENLVSQRWEAKQKKDFSRADELRARLQTMGIEVRDAASESTWEVIK